MTKGVQPLDLRGPSSRTWTRLEVPRGWEPVAEICRRVAATLPRLTERVVAAIEREIPAYQSAGTVPAADLSLSVRRNLEGLLLSIAERRGPLPEDLAVRREVGHRRAMQGLGVDALLQAFYVGYRELWDRLVEEASADPAMPPLLLTTATTAWEWVHHVTSAVIEAYQETLQGRELFADGIRRRFVELLVSGSLASEELAELSRSLGFDPEGRFQALCARPASMAGGEPRRLRAELSLLAGTHECIIRGIEILILLQDSHANEIEGVLRRIVPGCPVGVGVERRGLEGARLSIGDAERAVAVAASRGGTSRFADDWLAATLVREERLRALFEEGIEAARRHPHLAETVRAFKESAFSVSGAARRLRLHPNTVIYRLERWHALTGWDPRTYEGLSRSLASIDLLDTTRGTVGLGRKPETPSIALDG